MDFEKLPYLVRRPANFILGIRFIQQIPGITLTAVGQALLLWTMPGSTPNEKYPKYAGLICIFGAMIVALGNAKISQLEGEISTSGKGWKTLPGRLFSLAISATTIVFSTLLGWMAYVTCVIFFDSRDSLGDGAKASLLTVISASIVFLIISTLHRYKSLDNARETEGDPISEFSDCENCTYRNRTDGIRLHYVEVPIRKSFF